MNKLQQGEFENMTHRRCQQTQCLHFLHGGEKVSMQHEDTKEVKDIEIPPCQECEDCNAAPLEINKKCKRCLDCENVPGSCRWGNAQWEPKQEQTNKPIELEQQTKIIEPMILKH